MVAPMVRHLRAKCHGDGHLGHHRRTAASDQAAVDQQHATTGARGFDCGIHSGAARPNDEDVRFGPHRLTAHVWPPGAAELRRRHKCAKLRLKCLPVFSYNLAHISWRAYALALATKTTISFRNEYQ